MSHDLLLEVGTEEIPAGYLAKAMVALKAECEKVLATARLGFSEVQTMGTPRRLTLAILSLDAKQSDLEEEMVGPPARVAFDDEGKPTKAAMGFAKRNNIAIDELRKGSAAGKKGEYLLCTKREAGLPAAEILPALLGDLLKKLHWPKSMRWYQGEVSFVRPVHWIVCMLGGQTLPLRFVGIDSGKLTRGHRFLAPDPFELDGDVTSYVQALRKAFVIVDPKARRRMITAEIERIEKEVGCQTRSDEALVDEVTNLVEYPVGVCGQFPTEYLEVPEQVIVSAMRSHQRYFSMNNSEGELTNRFITIAGTVTRDVDVVRRGNERVLAARLSDAQFFFSEDKKHSLDEFAKKLDAVVFQKKLGSTGEKVIRLSAGAQALAAELGVDNTLVKRAAALCKADLTSQMVGEFPELQGTMGRRYARLAGEPEEVATAIEEHYLPRGASDDLPASDVAAVVGIADRLDTIAGCFSIGTVPTGSADPFGLRRAALGILRLLTERDWKVDIRSLVARAVKEVTSQQEIKADCPAVEAQILDFLRVRFRGLLTDGHGLPADCVDAALAVGFHDPRDARARAEAVSLLRKRDDFEPLAAAFKRVANILKGQSGTGEPSVAAFVQDEERSLWTAFEGIEKRVGEGVSAGTYVEALTIMSELKGPVDSFFEAVMVMDEDMSVRENRLAMLSRINHTFTKIADFRQLAV